MRERNGRAIRPTSKGEPAPGGVVSLRRKTLPAGGKVNAADDQGRTPRSWAGVAAAGARLAHRRMAVSAAAQWSLIMRTTGTLVLALLVLSPATAIPPNFMPDEEMARLPIVVVAKWDKKAPLRAHNLVEGDVLLKLEGHTELIIERVIKGDIKPGKHKLLLGAFIGWAEKGGPVMSYTSTEMVGDTNDVTKPNLWFLTPKRSSQCSGGWVAGPRFPPRTNSDHRLSQGANRH